MTLHVVISEYQACDRNLSLLRARLVSRNKTESQEVDHSSRQFSVVLLKIFRLIIALFLGFMRRNKSRATMRPEENI